MKLKDAAASKPESHSKKGFRILVLCALSPKSKNNQAWKKDDFNEELCGITLYVRVRNPSSRTRDPLQTLQAYSPNKHNSAVILVGLLNVAVTVTLFFLDKTILVNLLYTNLKTFFSFFFQIYFDYELQNLPKCTKYLCHTFLMQIQDTGGPKLPIFPDKKTNRNRWTPFSALFSRERTLANEQPGSAFMTSRFARRDPALCHDFHSQDFLFRKLQFPRVHTYIGLIAI